MRSLAFPNLEAEMCMKRHSVRSLIMLTDLNYSTIAPKLKTGKKVTIDEGFEIQDALKTDKSLDELFQKRNSA